MKSLLTFTKEMFMTESNQSLTSLLAKTAQRQQSFASNLTTEPSTIRATQKTGEPVCIPLIIDLQNPNAESVVVFPSIQSVLLSKSEREKYRARYERTDLIMPDNRVVRDPSETPQGWSAYFLGVDGALDIALVQGSPAWMEKLSSGWFLNILSQNESSTNGRWRWWMSSRESGGFISDQIPQLDLQDKPAERAILQLKWAMDIIDADWQRSPDAAFAAIDYLFDYLLWGLGSPMQPEPPEDTFGTGGTFKKAGVFDRLYQSFDSTPLLLYPYPYFGWLLADIGKQVGDSRYESPMPVQDAKALAAQMFPQRREDYRKELLIDPEIDTGLSLPLAASNYTCNIILTTTDKRLVKAAHLTSFFYIPWIMYPAAWVTDKDSYITVDCDRTRNVARRYEMAFMEKNLDSNYLENPLSEWSSTQPIQLLTQDSDMPTIEPTPLIPGSTWSEEYGKSFNPGQSPDRKVLIPANTTGQANRFKLSGRTPEQIKASEKPTSLLAEGTQSVQPPIDVPAQVAEPIFSNATDSVFDVPAPLPISPTTKMDTNTGTLRIANSKSGAGVKINREADRVPPIQLPTGRVKPERKRGTIDIKEVKINRLNDNPNLLGESNPESD